jgi:HD-like signal output (HDOD) protein
MLRETLPTGTEGRLQKAESFINRVTHLPPSPTLLNELLGLFRDPDRDIDRVVELLSHDPSLTAEILRKCNGAFFGGAPASDMFEAVSRIGFYEVYCMVVALFGAKTKALPGVGNALDASKLWKHTVVTAVAGSTIAIRTDHPQGAAFTAGLLHDIGKLVLASAERYRYGEILEDAKLSGLSHHEAEQVAYGTNHAEIGGLLLERWKLPSEVYEAVRHHHDPGQAGANSRMATIIFLADWMAHGFEAGKPLPVTAAAGKAFVSLGMGPAELPKLNEATVKALERVKGLLEL